MALLDTLGKRIKALRADSGMSQKELARRIRTAQSHLSEVEADSVPRVSGELLARIASALGTTTDYLLLLTADPRPQTSLREDELPPEVVALWRRIAALPPHVREQAIAYLEEQLQTFERLFVPERR